MIESSFAITGTFIAYLILMVAIGVYAYKKTSSSSDYFLVHGQRRCPLGRRT